MGKKRTKQQKKRTKQRKNRTKQRRKWRNHPNVPDSQDSGDSSGPSTPQECCPVHVIIHDHFDSPDDENTEIIAKEKVQEILRCATYEPENMVFGNEGGKSLLRQIEEMKRDLATFKTDTASHIATLKTDTASHSNDIQTLKMLAEGFINIRDRRMKCYQRDFYGGLTHQDRESIQQGNENAHDGDATADAYLYEIGRQTDEQLFVDLYGLGPNEIRDLGKRRKFDSIRVLNAWSTRVSCVGKSRVPEEVARAFDKFLTILRRDFNANPQEEGTEIKEAYDKFWEANVKMY